MRPEIQIPKISRCLRRVYGAKADIPSTTNYVGKALMRLLFGLIAGILIGIYLSASFPRELHGIITLIGIHRG